MKTNKIWITAALSLLFVGCSTQKQAVGNQPTKPIEQKSNNAEATAKKQMLQFVQKVSDKALYQNNVVSNLSFTLNTGSKNITVPGTLRMRKDEVIRLQLLVPILRSEVGRIEFTKDYVLFIDRIHKQYVKASYNDVAFLRDNGINFYSLQALFWNQLFVPRQQRVGESSLTQFAADLTALQSPNKAIVPVTLKDGRMTYKWLAESLSGLITQAEAKYVSPTHGASTLTWNYANFQNFGSKKFPMNHELVIETAATKAKKTLKATFELDGLTDNADWEAFTTPSTKYQQVSVEEILGKLTSL